jgi:hypothetical protein
LIPCPVDYVILLRTVKEVIAQYAKRSGGSAVLAIVPNLNVVKFPEFERRIKHQVGETSKECRQLFILLRLGAIA